MFGSRAQSTPKPQKMTSSPKSREMESFLFNRFRVQSTPTPQEMASPTQNDADSPRSEEMDSPSYDPMRDFPYNFGTFDADTKPIFEEDQTTQRTQSKAMLYLPAKASHTTKKEEPTQDDDSCYSCLCRI